MVAKFMVKTWTTVGGIPTPLQNMKVSWDDYPIYEMEKKSHVPNHQPVIINH